MSGGQVAVSSRAYAKLTLHAAKYPQSGVCGLLLGVANASPTAVTDAIPLFHQCLHVTPMAEVALAQIDALAQSAGLAIVGYYAACENFKDNSIEKAPGLRIAEKIAEIYPSALFIILDNRKFSMEVETHALKVAQFQEGKWKMKDPTNVIVDSSTMECVMRLLKSAAYKTLVDYDNHLDDISLDWANNSINAQIDQLMPMFT
ncbi:ER membrane protein complex subunit 8/9 [Arctopsyche grandis]|uniref:ER membrane protein complex subunit 8/9 n=1 Tax=Arctopsyche grandis TaxID=121162 RepID=UPI00406D6759